jgi:transcriptional regulator with XRE-family HTH domain
MARTLPRPNDTLDPVAHDIAALGLLVRNQRARDALRIDDAADLVGVTHDVLSKIENGQSVGLQKLFKVLDGLGLKMLIVTPTEAEDAVRSLRPPVVGEGM